MKKLTIPAFVSLFLLIASLGAGLAAQRVGVQLVQTYKPKVRPEVLEIAQKEKSVRVSVLLKVPSYRTDRLSAAEESKQKAAIVATQDALLKQLAGRTHTVLGRSKSIPAIHLEVDAAALEILEKSDLVDVVSGEAGVRFQRFLD